MSDLKLKLTHHQFAYLMLLEAKISELDCAARLASNFCKPEEVRAFQEAIALLQDRHGRAVSQYSTGIQLATPADVQLVTQ